MIQEKFKAMKKTLIIIVIGILLLFIISACLDQERQITGILNDLKNQTNFTYSEIEPVNFTWQDQNIKGQGTQTLISPNFAHEIINFFRNNKFENIGQQNYQKKKLVCQIFQEKVGTKIKIIINCGKL